VVVPLVVCVVLSALGIAFVGWMLRTAAVR
jgi:hypothetical protein